ncbi:hypothetical protein [Streptomyces sp. NPDC008092]|uniref:hypothetical protein n=1 Tax=Streptomyces sp. NPDC008092 TaxID=3364808 RepID=UPI0036EE05F7
MRSSTRELGGVVTLLPAKRPEMPPFGRFLERFAGFRVRSPPAFAVGSAPGAGQTVP